MLVDVVVAGNELEGQLEKDSESVRAGEMRGRMRIPYLVYRILQLGQSVPHVDIVVESPFGPSGCAGAVVMT